MQSRTIRTIPFPHTLSSERSERIEGAACREWKG
jgi:hypothetical protein